MSANPGALPGWFPRRSDDIQPDSENHSDETSPNTTAAQSTTGGGRDDQTPVVVWEAANRLEAEVVAGRLHSEGIPAIIRGEILGAIYGLTTGTLAAANVLVPAALAEKALAILATSVEWDETDGGDGADSILPKTDTNQERDG
jgi:hypothetical protein